MLAVYYGVLTDWNFHLEPGFPWFRVGSYVDLRLTLPFVPTRFFEPNLGWLYLPFMVFVIVATSNAVNLTDGLDGLAIGPTIVSSMTFLALSLRRGRDHRRVQPRRVPAHRLHPRGGGARRSSARAIIGAGIAFLWFNTYPASGLHGRRRLARARRRARHARGPHEERGRERDPARRLPRRDGERHPAGLVRSARPASASSGWRRSTTTSS